MQYNDFYTTARLQNCYVMQLYLCVIILDIFIKINQVCMLRSFTAVANQGLKMRMLLRYRNSQQKQVQLTTQNAVQLIERMVKTNKICLFMKGTPESPACGYSNFVVELLKKYGLTNFKSVDVLENPIMRDKVKTYSKWPTYPQLFIDGELVGGSDILHEMHKDQSLQKLLQEKKLI